MPRNYISLSNSIFKFRHEDFHLIQISRAYVVQWKTAYCNQLYLCVYASDWADVLLYQMNCRKRMVLCILLLLYNLKFICFPCEKKNKKYRVYALVSLQNDIQIEFGIHYLLLFSSWCLLRMPMSVSKSRSSFTKNGTTWTPRHRRYVRYVLVLYGESVENNSRKELHFFAWSSAFAY